MLPPAGRLGITQVGLSAGLGPLLTQVSVPVTVDPAAGFDGKPDKVACISATGDTCTVCCAMLLAPCGSIVLDAAVPSTVTLPVGGTVKLTVHTIDAPTAKLVTGGVGAQLTKAPGGSPLTAQVALAATLGPALVQVTVPDTRLPATAFVGKPVTVACISADGVTAIVLLSALFDGAGSWVLLPAVVVMLTTPDAGAVKVLVQVMTELGANGTTAGEQLCVAPAGRPASEQLGAAASLGPALTH
jgi:hypothetical protein